MTKTKALALATLRDAYRAHNAALIAKYPAQQANAATYAREADIAELGRMRSNVATKGNHSTYEAGELVLVWPSAWSMSDDTTVWHPRNPCRTVVAKCRVEVIAPDDAKTLQWIPTVGARS